MTWLGKKRQSCRECRAELRALVEETPGALSVEDLLKSADGELREHIACCRACNTLLGDALEARKLLRESFTPAAVPDTFASRVTAAIRARETAPVPAAYPWTAVETLASRVAWVSGLVLLVASTWVYQHDVPSPAPDMALDAAVEPEPASQPEDLDEVLVSLAEVKR